jgi:hypothetical protein
MSSAHTIQHSIWLTDQYYSKYSKQYIVLSFEYPHPSRNISSAIIYNYRWTSISANSVSAVDCGPRKIWKIKEINGS